MILAEIVPEELLRFGLQGVAIDLCEGQEEWKIAGSHWMGRKIGATGVRRGQAGLIAETFKLLIRTRKNGVD